MQYNFKDRVVALEKPIVIMILIIVFGLDQFDYFI